MLAAMVAEDSADAQAPWNHRISKAQDLKGLVKQPRRKLLDTTSVCFVECILPLHSFRTVNSDGTVRNPKQVELVLHLGGRGGGPEAKQAPRPALGLVTSVWLVVACEQHTRAWR